MHGIYCLCEQTAKVDRSHYIISLSHHKLIRNFNLFQPYKFSKFSDRLDCVAAVERLPALHYSVDFIFLSFGIMGFIVEL